MTKKKIATGIVAAGLVCASAGFAAPAAGPAVNERITPAPPAASLIRLVTLTGSYTSVDCGAPWDAVVTVKNVSAAPWSGNVIFTIDGVPMSEAVTVAKGENKTLKLIHPSKIMDCTKALGSGSVVARGTNGVVQGNFNWGPDAVNMQSDVNLTPPQGFLGEPWLKMLFVSGNCGHAVTTSALIHNSGPLPKPVTIKLAWGATTTDATATVPANGELSLPFNPPSTLDCQAATGIPTLTWTYVNAKPSTGVVRATYINVGPRP